MNIYTQQRLALALYIATLRQRRMAHPAQSSVGVVIASGVFLALAILLALLTILPAVCASCA